MICLDKGRRGLCADIDAYLSCHTRQDFFVGKDTLMRAFDRAKKIMASYEEDNRIFCLQDKEFEDVSIYNDPSFYIFPGFCDVHVHLREPGFSYKETVASGTAAAAHGGYTAVCTMPNLDPVPDSPQHLKIQQDIIDKDACIAVYPYGAITEGEKGERLAAMTQMAPNVIAFSDDGRGVQSKEMMRKAMETAGDLGKIIAAHCEDNSLLKGGYIHDGVYARKHGHRGICSESEYIQIERDLKLAEETGCAYHVCHISTAESVDLIRRAKARGTDVTCETAPHYLILTEEDLLEEGRFKMNPPLRTEKDRKALIEGIKDGTIDMIATDHAPHSREEKSRGLEKSAFGITGIETAFPLMWTHMVKTGIISAEKLIDLMALNPRKRFGIPLGNDFTVWSMEETVIDTSEFLSKGKATPFSGEKVFGKCLLTVYDGRIVYK